MLNCENTPAATETCQRPPVDRNNPIVCPSPTLETWEPNRGDRSHRYVAKKRGSFGSARRGRKMSPLGSGSLVTAAS